MARTRSRNRIKVDWVVVLTYAVLVFWGWISIYAAVFNEEAGNIVNLTQEYGKQGMFMATSLVIIAVKSAAGFIKYLDLLQDLQLSVDWTLITVFAAIGMVGSLIGQMLVKKIPQRQAEQVFAVFLVLISGWILSQTVW